MANSWEAQLAAKVGGDASRLGDEVREACEGGESAEDVARDEWAERLRAGGADAGLAARLADVVLGWMRMKDARACGGAGGRGEGGGLWRPEALEALRLMGLKVVQAPKPRFSAGCFLFAAGFEVPGARSIREWCAAQNLSPEHGSNEVQEWQRSMKLPKTSGQKSEAACKSYKETNGRRTKGER